MTILIAVYSLLALGLVGMCLCACLSAGSAKAAAIVTIALAVVAMVFAWSFIETMRMCWGF